VIVNCAGRTRSIIGARRSSTPGSNRVAAAERHHGWALEGLALAHGQTGRAPEPSAEAGADAASAARGVADRAGVRRLSAEGLQAFLSDRQRTVYRFDVRNSSEYEASHVQGFRNAPGGQLVQETDVFAPVRGARIVLWDPAGARADMTASWLAQMNWEVYVLDAGAPELPQESGAWRPNRPALPPVVFAAPAAVAGPRARRVLIDFAEPQYRRSHIAGAWFVSAPRRVIGRAVAERGSHGGHV
jgi:rhodanese-related sulfurtransferase